MLLTLIFAVHSQTQNNNQLRQPLDSELVRRYQMMFVRLTSFSNWTVEDVDNNGVIYGDNQIPSFVGELEQILAMKRRVPINVRHLLIWHPDHLIND
jgi:hypothetical protein